VAGLREPEPDYDTPPQGGGRDFRQNWVPVPDPTLLTQQAVDRAISGFREYVDTRLAAMGRATELNAVKVEQMDARAELERGKAAADVERQMAALREFALERISHVADVATEKITGLERMLAERDERVRQAAAEAKTGLDAALTAQSAIAAQTNAATALASNKQEVGFQKLLDQQAATSRAEIEALKNQVGDLKDRLGRAETLAAQALTAASTRIDVKTEGRTDNRALATIGIAIVGIILSVVLALTLRPR
jgi:hypothetical protein